MQEGNNKDQDWLSKTFLVRAKEVLVLLSFIVGITFTVLIATEILFWGMLALGIFEAISFLGANNFFGSFSPTESYYEDGPNGGKSWGNPLLKGKERRKIKISITYIRQYSHKKQIKNKSERNGRDKNRIKFVITSKNFSKTF